MNERAYVESLVDTEYATRVKCCEAGQVAYPSPCPWHETTDPMYTMTREAMPWGGAR